MGKSSKIWFGHNFWLEGPIDLRPTRLNSILQDLFRDTVLDHIGPLKYVPKYAKYGKICIFGAYLGAPNMVKWGVPEKILQNAVQTR